MSYELQAKDTFGFTREFYKDGLKSSNKKYFVKSPGGQVIESEETPKHEIRNTFADLSRGMARPSLVDTSPYEVGRDRLRKALMMGNCGEMAAVAVCVAIDIYRVPETEVFYVDQNYSDGGYLWFKKNDFTHTFAVIGRPGTQRWVVDPWAGVWCSAEKYADQVRNKLAKWTQQGKRILATLEDQMQWVEPTNAIVLKMVESDWKEVPAKHVFTKK